MNKKYYFHVLLMLFIFISIITSGCSSDESIPKDQIQEESTSIIAPSIKVNEEYYRGVLPYKSSPIGRMLIKIPTRLNANHFEMGLIELAKQNYDPAQFVFQEGQALTMNEIEPLFKQKGNENFLYSVTEHDYLYEDGKYGGIVIGILVSSTYEVEVEGQKVKKFYTEKELEENSLRIIEDLASLIRKRKNLEEPSIYFAVMKTEENDVKLPGTFIFQGNVKGKSEQIEDWKKVNEYFIFLPSSLSGLEDKDSEIVRGFNYFKKEMDEYLPRYSGVVGLAKKVNGELVELTIRVNTETDSTVEIIQLTQFAISIIPEFFQKDIQLNLYVNSIDQPKAIYVRQANGDDFMHIFRTTYQP